MAHRRRYAGKSSTGLIVGLVAAGALLYLTTKSASAATNGQGQGQGQGGGGGQIGQQGGGGGGGGGGLTDANYTTAGATTQALNA